MSDDKELQSDCCACLTEAEEISYGCADRKYVFTRREHRVLGRIREASLRARAIKAIMRGRTPGDVVLEEAEKELDDLRRLREELEIERLAAAEERMRLLGHI